MKDTALRALTEDAPVEVGMKDGASLKGRISMTAEQSFTLAIKNGSRTVSYFEVAEMKKGRGKDWAG